MKILFAVHHFPPTFNGGAEWRAWRTANGLIKRGHDVKVVCVDSIDDGDGQTLFNKETVYRGVPVIRLRFKLSRTPDAFQSSFKNDMIGEYLKGLANQFNPDIVHLISGYLMSGSVITVAKSLQMPVALSLTDFWFLCPRITLTRSDGSLCTTPAQPEACALCIRKERRRYLYLDLATAGFGGRALSVFWKMKGDRLLKSLEFRKDYLSDLFRTVDVAISPSRFLKTLFEKQGISPKRFLQMRQGLDLQNATPSSKRKISKPIRIGYIGQIAKHKGVDVLIDAFCRLKKERTGADLILYGGLSDFPRFSKRIQKKVQKRCDITFAGKFENTQIREIHETIDVLVVPSVWYENSPNVILESFAFGTPVVVSRLGGMAELVKDGVTGFSFETGNPDALSRCLKRFLEIPDLVSEFSRKASPVKFLDQEINELIHQYEQLISK